MAESEILRKVREVCVMTADKIKKNVLKGIIAVASFLPAANAVAAGGGHLKNAGNEKVREVSTASAADDKKNDNFYINYFGYNKQRGDGFGLNFYKGAYTNSKDSVRHNVSAEDFRGAVVFEGDSVSYDAYIDYVKDLQKKHNELYGRPTHYVTDTVSIYDGIRDQLGLRSKSAINGASQALAAFRPGKNTIELLWHTMQDRDKAVELVMQHGKVTRDKAEHIVDTEYKEWTENIDAVKAHEESHRDDYQKGLMEPDLPLKYMLALNCLTEIKGNMVSAAVSLKNVRAENDPSLLFLSGNMHPEKLADDLLKHNYTGSWREYVGKFVYNDWLDTYKMLDDRYNAGYMAGYREEFGSSSGLSQKEQMIRFHIADNPEARREYYRRVSEMFKNVRGLGDMRGVIEADFEQRLSLGLQQMLKEKRVSGLQLITENSRTTEEAYERVSELFKTVKKAGYDKERTEKEKRLIEDKIRELKNRKTVSGEGENWAGYLAGIRKQEKSADKSAALRIYKDNTAQR